MKNNIITISLLSLLLVSCGKDSKEESKKVNPVLVTVQAVSENHDAFLTVSGTVEAENSANLSTRMMGHVAKIHVKVGQKVAVGQLLVSINNSDLQAKKAQVDASIAQATAGFNNAKKDYDRFVNLFASQSASQKELDDMTTRYEMAKAGLEAAKQMRNEVMAQFSYSNITAPFSGTISHTFVKEGDMANPGMPLISVEGVSSYQVVARVSENDISKIKNGMEVQVFLKSKNEYLKGKVSEMSLSSNQTGGQYIVKINLDKTTTKVLPGMFASVQFPLEKTSTEADNRILIPSEVIFSKGDLKGIYTISQQNTAVLRWIRTGRVFGNQTEVLSGLNKDEKYILNAEGKLYNGVQIKIK
jgi:RND family efflux transporter MFP subunit